MKKFNFRTPNSIQFEDQEIEACNQCPYCFNYSMNQIQYIEANVERNMIATVYECLSCFRFYFSIHYYPAGMYKCIPNVSVYPTLQAPSDIAIDFQSIYPRFYSLYNQAIQAEQYNLIDIAGMGFRKALEILVKDFCIEKFPNEIDRITKEPLSQSIDRINNPQIADMAKAASWLGNDQTHYHQKHPDYNLQDMKNFIHGLIHLIELEHLCQKSHDFLNQ